MKEGFFLVVWVGCCIYVYLPGRIRCRNDTGGCFFPRCFGRESPKPLPTRTSWDFERFGFRGHGQDVTSWYKRCKFQKRCNFSSIIQLMGILVILFWGLSSRGFRCSIWGSNPRIIWFQDRDLSFTTSHGSPMARCNQWKHVFFKSWRKYHASS